MSYIDEHIEYLGVHEGTKGGLKRVEDSSKSAAPYGLDNPPIDRKDKETDKAFAKRVLQHFEKKAQDTFKDAYSNAPTGVKRAVLDSYYNSGKLYDGQIASLKGSDYKGFARNTLDIVSAKDDAKNGISAVSKGLANRKAATYNLMAADAGLPLITGGEFLEVDGKARIIYNTTGEPYTFDFNKPRHTKSDPGALNVIAPKKVEALGKQSSIFTGEKIDVAGTDLSGIFTNETESQYGKDPGIKYPNQNLSNTQKDLGTVELPPDQKITPYRETIKEDVTVRPDQIRVNEDVQLTSIPTDARQYSIGEQQERARRSMMQGNRQDRMEDYKYDREYQEDYPYLYPRNTGSYALPQQQAAQRMMGGGMGYAQGGTVNQAQGLASSNQSNNPGMSLAPPAPNQAAQGLASLGRGGDSTLVHMQPQEVAGLQQMAQANGTSLTTNPMTGYPEAFRLGNMFKAALPIAAGYLTGGAATPFLGAGTATASAITAGAATGAGIAAVSGEDVLAGGLSGGLGGYSGMGLETALGGSAIPAAGGAGAGSTVNPALVSSSAPITSTASAGSVGSFNPALDSTLTTAGGGAAPLTPGNVFDSSINPGASTLDTMKQNLGVFETGYADVSGGLPGEQYLKKSFVPGDNLDVAKTLGSPAVSMGLGGLEESDFIVEPDFDDPRDKYDPYSRLNLNKDTGISSALAADTGLRLLAEGGSINLNQKGQNLNQQGQNLNQRGQNVNSRGINIGGRGINTRALTGMQGLGSLNVNTGATSASDEEQAILDKSLFKDIGFTGIGGYRGPSRVPYDYSPGNRISGGANYTTNRDGTFTRIGPVPEGSLEDQQQKIKDRLAGSGPTNLNSRGLNLSGKRKFAVGGYLKGPGDGMSDDIPATINGEQPAALADGEFVVPADVVSHLGNGSSEAGSKQLYAMMDRIRKARTGRKSQGKEIKPGKYMPR